MFFKTIIILSLLLHCLANGECPNLLHKLAIEQMNLLKCITMNSAPVTMCFSCPDHYHNVLHAYDLLVANCTTTYFDKDRINLVASTESVLTGLWSKAYCDDCFNNNNGFVFDNKNKTFYDCLNQHKVNPCEECKENYLDLNNFYINLDQHNNGEVCYDLQDSMNRTRNTWSKEHKCCQREYNMTLFTVALCITLSLPLFFYCGTYFLTKRQERNHGVLNDEDPLFNPSSSTIRNVSSANEPSSSNNTQNNVKNDVKIAYAANVDSSDDDDDEPMLYSTNNSKEKLK